MTTAATVVSLSGEAFARAANGSMRRLANGDKIQQGEVVITSAGAQVNLTTADGQSMTVGSQESFTFGPETTRGTAPSAAEAAVAGTPAVAAAPGELNVEQLLEQEAAAAGLGGGGENGGNSFVRLLRVTEELTPLSYEFTNPAEGEILPAAGAEGADVPTAGNLDIALDEDDIHYSRHHRPDLDSTGWFDDFMAAVGGDKLSRYDNGNSDVAPGDDVPDPTPTTMVGKLNFSYGPDGVGDLVLNMPTLDLTSDGKEVQYWLSADGHTLVGYIIDEGCHSGEDVEVVRMQQEGNSGYGGDYGPPTFIKVIFAAEITDVANGEFAFTLYGPLDHPDTSTEDNLILPFGFTVTDGTGDAANGTLTVNIDDDSPMLCHRNPEDTVAVEDEKMQDWWGRFLTDEWDGGVAQVVGTIEDNAKWGADGFGGAVGFKVGEQEFDVGTAVFWDQYGNFLGSYAPGGGSGEDQIAIDSIQMPHPAAVLVVNADGSYFFALLDNMLLGYGEDGEQVDLLDTVAITGVDGDGDRLDVNVNLQVQDDKPFCITDPDVVIVEDEKMPGGIDEHGWGDYPSQMTGTIVDDVAWGADGFGGTAGFVVNWQHFAPGTTVYWDQYGNFLGALSLPEGGAGEDALVASIQLPQPAAMLVVNADGSYTFTLLDNMLLGYGEHGEQIDLLETVGIIGQDGDGDRAYVNLSLKVQDDVPVAVCDHNMVVEGATLTVSAANGVLANDLPGADGASVYSASTSSKGSTPLGPDGEVTLTGKYGTLTLYADGSYEYETTANSIRHDATDTFYYTIRDGDGDRDQTTLTIKVDDVTLNAYAWNDSRNNGEYDGKYIDNQTATFKVDFDAWQNTGDGGKWSSKLSLPEGENFDTKSHPLVNYKLDPINIQHDANITFTFQSEGAGYKNAVGWYEMDAKGNPTVGHVVWSNASADGSGGSLEAGDMVTAAVTAGMKIGFFMIPDGYDSGLPDTVYFQNGHAYADAGHTQLINSNDNDWQLSDGNKYTNNTDTDPVWFSSSANLDGLQHAIAGTSDGSPDNVLNVAFEDLGGGGDKDYNDVVFKVDLGEGNDVSFNEVVFNLGVDLLPDVALKSATIDFALGDGDTVSWDSAMADKSGLTVTVDKSGDVTITADDATNGSLAIEDLLDTFRINVGNTGAGGDYTKVDTDPRTATVSVMDIYGNESNDVTAVFNLMVKTDPNPT